MIPEKSHHVLPEDEQLSVHFNRGEFACGCGCEANNIDPALVEALEKIRACFGRPMRINSGVRCAAHNAAVGGKADSQHLAGKAADIVVEGVSPEDVHAAADRIINGNGGVGRYATFTHVDVRGNAARWNG